MTRDRNNIVNPQEPQESERITPNVPCTDEPILFLETDTLEDYAAKMFASLERK